ncbi:MAG TPA: hypothetical protein VHB21_21570, partial [Minicystis sp.]|nr:hypothetical protein [Minicystis sp.]
MKLRALLLLSVAPALAGCPTSPPARPHEDFGVASKGDDPVALDVAKAPDPADLQPDVSRSRGHKGGMVVLWPRVSVATGGDASKAHDAARDAELRLEALAHRAGGARAVDRRPEPEARCPKDGCEATSVSAVVFARPDGCAAVAMIAGPKKSPAHLLKWAGDVELTSDIVPLGAGPEPLVKVKTAVPCEKLFEKRENE